MNYGELTDATCDAIQAPRLTWGPRARVAINDTIVELASTLRLAQPLATLTVTPGLGDYTLAAGLGVTDAAQIRDVFYQPVGQTQAGPPLERTSPSRIDEIRARNLSSSYPMMYAIAGVGSIILGPVPSDAGTLSFRYVQAGTALAGDSDTPTTIPAGFHDVIWLGAARRLLLMRRPALPPVVTGPLQQVYAARLSDLRSWIVDMGGSKPMRMQRAGSPIQNRDPSVYPIVQSY